MIPNFIRSFDGPLTRSLHRLQGNFGLGQVPGTTPPRATTTSVCGYCSTGCGLNVHLGGRSPVELTPDPSYPVNLGMACPKGWEALAVLDAPDRGTTPLLRDRLTGERRPISWEDALAIMVSRLKGIRDLHGPESAAFLSTGQIPTEEMFFLGALWKLGFGFLHADSNTRQCMATAHVAYKQSFGFDAPPFSYDDFEESDVLVFVGANPCIAHPILWERVMMNVRSPKIVVVDPRRTETAQASSLHVPLAPKSDLVLWYTVLRKIVERGWVDREFVDSHTTGFQELSVFLEEFDDARCLQDTGLEAGQLESLVESFRPGRRVSIWWTMGVNQSHEAVRTAQALIDICLVTGNIGKPGTGPNSITGQANAMGSRLYSMTTSLPGGRDFANPEHRAQVSRIMGIPEDRIPGTAGLAYDQILDRAAEGGIKALWVVATNPEHTWIGQDAFVRARENLEFLVVQDMYHSTETALQADLYLPAAGWGEKEGTQINSERRIGLTKKVRRPPGLALPDFDIFRLLAAAWGCADLFPRFANPESAFGLMRDLSRDRPHDFTGIRDYRHIDVAGGIQWPFPEGARPAGPDHSVRPGAPEELRNLLRGDEGHRRLFSDGRFFTPDGKARLLFDPPRPPEEPTDAEFDLVLLTGRGSSAEWHTGTRTSKSALLRTLAPGRLLAEIHPSDARTRGIRPGDAILVSSRRGSLRAEAMTSPNVRPGTIFLPMHHREVNRLTFPSFDPYSREPSYKHAAVRMEVLP
ncbi:MAG: molybdopterin oxidoreductase family protein [Fibrobacteria bacterium]|nr:molybdopterin oxidoreductase family protein [Fibrobacteria bacterium]